MIEQNFLRVFINDGGHVTIMTGIDVDQCIEIDKQDLDIVIKGLNMCKTALIVSGDLEDN